MLLNILNAQDSLHNNELSGSKCNGAAVEKHRYRAMRIELHSKMWIDLISLKFGEKKTDTKIYSD